MLVLAASEGGEGHGQEAVQGLDGQGEWPAGEYAGMKRVMVKCLELVLLGVLKLTVMPVVVLMAALYWFVSGDWRKRQ